MAAAHFFVPCLLSVSKQKPFICGHVHGAPQRYAEVLNGIPNISIAQEQMASLDMQQPMVAIQRQALIHILSRLHSGTLQRNAVLGAHQTIRLLVEEYWSWVKPLT